MDIRMSNIASPMPQIRAKFTNKLGIPLSGCKVYTYEPNSDIPKTTWIDTDKTVENTNPILLDAAGEADIFLDGLYRVVVKDRFGFVVYDVEKTGTHAEWDASFVVDGDKNQHQINEEQKAQNNNFKSKIRKTPYDFGALGGENDDTLAVKACIESGYFLINDAHKVQPLHILDKTVDGDFTPSGKLIFTHTNADSIIWENCKGIVRNPTIDDVDGIGGSYRTWSVYKSVGFNTYNLKVVGGKEVPVCIDESDLCFVIDSNQDNTGLWRPHSWQIVNSRASQFVRCNVTYTLFGMILIGPSYKSGPRPPTSRDLTYCVGMKAVDCTLTNTTNTCFDINGAVGAEFVRCIANQQGQSFSSPGFQIKQSTNIPEEPKLGTYANKITDCTAQNCAFGIGFQEGHFSKVTNFTAIDMLGSVIKFNQTPRVEINGLFVKDFGLQPTDYAVGGIANLLDVANISGNVIVRDIHVMMTRDDVDGSKINFINNTSNNVTLDNLQVTMLSSIPIYNTFIKNTGSFLRLNGSFRLGNTARYSNLIVDTSATTVYPTVISKVFDLAGATEVMYFDQMQSNGLVVGKVSTTALDLSGSDAQISVGISGNVAGLRALGTISAGTNVTDPNTIKYTTGNIPIVCRRQAGTTGTGKVLVQISGFDLL